MSLDDLPSVQLLLRYKENADEQAAAILYDRYAARLIALARSQMNAQLKRRIDPEEVVQSALRSFFINFRKASEGRKEIVVRPGDNLWSLLAAITMNKLFGKKDHHQAAKRDMSREVEPILVEGSVCLQPEQGMDREPGPDEAAALREELNTAMAKLKPPHRRMVEMRLEEYSTEEIAGSVGCSDRMVRYVLEEFGNRLRKRLDDGAE